MKYLSVLQLALALLSAVCPRLAIAQSAKTSPASPSSTTFDDSLAHARNRVTRAGMLTLGGWAAVNIATGFIVAGEQSGTTRYAWQMNAYWNFVNLGLAGMGYLRALKESRRSYSLLDNYDAQNALEKIYLFNFGLDLGYIGGGFYLRERGLNITQLKTSEQLRGYGLSIIIQGSFLLLEDATMIWLHRRNTMRVRQRLRAAAQF